MISPLRNFDIAIANPYGFTIYNLDFYNKAVHFDSEANQFIVHLDQLTQEQIQSRRVDVKIQTALDPTGIGKYENEGWQIVALNIAPIFQHIQGQKFQARKAWEAEAASIDPTDTIRQKFIQKYQKVFQTYAQSYLIAIQMEKLRPPSSVPPSTSSDFAHFYDSDEIPRDVVFELEPHRQDADDFKEEAAKSSSSSSSLLVEDQVQIKAHKFVLVGASSYFQRLFKSNMLETQTSVIKISEVSLAMFKKFVEFLYTKKVAPSSEKEAWELYRLGDQYEIERLKLITQDGHRRTNLRLADPKLFTKPTEFQEMLQKIDDMAQMAKAYKDVAQRIHQAYGMFLENYL